MVITIKVQTLRIVFVIVHVRNYIKKLNRSLGYFSNILDEFVAETFHIILSKCTIS